jgi:DNA-binding protein H-NS
VIKLETAINELENVFTEQKTRARQIIVDHKQLQNKLSMIKNLIKYPEISDNDWIINEIKKILKEDEKKN